MRARLCRDLQQDKEKPKADSDMLKEQVWFFMHDHRALVPRNAVAFRTAARVSTREERALQPPDPLSSPGCFRLDHRPPLAHPWAGHFALNSTFLLLSPLIRNNRSEMNNCQYWSGWQILQKLIFHSHSLSGELHLSGKMIICLRDMRQRNLMAGIACIS